MVKTLLVRGMIAGVVAGLVTLAFSYVFGEPGVNGGIAFEERAAAVAGESHGVELVGRGVQSTIGLGIAVIVYGVAIGGIFALVYSVVYGRIGRLTPRATAAVLAGGVFVVLYAAPFVKYPANPPGSNESATIGDRTGLYLVMVGFSVALGIGAIMLGRRLVARLGTWNAGLAAGAAYLVAVGVVEALLPVVNETPATFPATVLYDFRVASLGGQLVLWVTLGLVFGALTDGSSRRRRGQRSVTASGFPRSAHPSYDRIGCPLCPEASGAHTPGPIPPAAARSHFQGQGPIAPVVIPSRERSITRRHQGFTRVHPPGLPPRL